MTIFKSRQVNLDPLPYVDAVGVRTNHPQGPADKRYEPRPEFEPTRDPYPMQGKDGGRYRYVPGRSGSWAPRRAQYDTPINRVLARFRHASEPEFILRYLPAYLIGLEQWATPEEIEHARRVLSRLKEGTDED